MRFALFGSVIKTGDAESALWAAIDALGLKLLMLLLLLADIDASGVGVDAAGVVVVVVMAIAGVDVANAVVVANNTTTDNPEII